MKRAELEVGARLYHTNKRYWERDTWGAREVVVLSTEPYEEYRFSTKESFVVLHDGVEYEASGNIRKADGGNGVLVGYEAYRPWHSSGEGHYPVADVVTLGSLKGDYDTIVAENEAREKRNEEISAAREVERRKREARFAHVAHELNELIPELKIRISHWTDDATFGVEDLERIEAKLRAAAEKEAAAVHAEECR